MRKNKADLLTIVLIVVYVSLMLQFGLPLPKRDITRGHSYAIAVQEIPVLRQLHVIRKPLLLVGFLAFAFGCGLMAFQGSYVDLSIAAKDTKQIIRATKLCLFSFMFALLMEIIILVLSVAAMSKASKETLKEFARVDFLWAIGVGFCAVYYVYIQIGWLKYLSCVSKYFEEHSKKES